jgi:Family of unknown function (DUF6335)
MMLMLQQIVILYYLKFSKNQILKILGRLTMAKVQPPHSNSEPENSEDLPQAITESYGTGVKEAPGYSIGGRTQKAREDEFNEASPELTGGDVDANYEQANADGDESVGGTVVTPDMDIVDDLGKAVGLEMNDSNFLHTSEILEQRDERRWELEPKSSEDYQERRDSESNSE